MKKQTGLGKGLGALIVSESHEQGSVLELDINKIEPNRLQPRKNFDEETIKELADSISQYGIVQPIIVKNEGDFYSIIAGERRYRAARLLKLQTIPAIVKEYSEGEVLQIALIENIQREDLNPLEEAMCYKRLIDEYFFTQETIAEKVGKSRSVIGNALRLLTLDNRVQVLLAENKLSEGLARVLLTISDKDSQFNMAEKMIDDEMTVKEAAEYVKAVQESMEKLENQQFEIIHKKVEIAEYKTLERDLKVLFGAKVQIKEKNKKGKIEIQYQSRDELDRILSMFKGLQAE